MSVPTPPVSLPQGPGQRRTATDPAAKTPPPLPGVRCRPAAGRGRRSAAGRGGSGSRCPDARNGREHRRSYRRLRSWWDAVRAATCQSPRRCGWERAAAARTGLLLMPRWLLVCCSQPCRRADGPPGAGSSDGRRGEHTVGLAHTHSITGTRSPRQPVGGQPHRVQPPGLRLQAFVDDPRCLVGAIRHAFCRRPRCHDPGEDAVMRDVLGHVGVCVCVNMK